MPWAFMEFRFQGDVMDKTRMATLVYCSICFRPITAKADYRSVFTGDRYEAYQPMHAKCAAEYTRPIIDTDYADE